VVEHRALFRPSVFFSLLYGIPTQRQKFPPLLASEPRHPQRPSNPPVPPVCARVQVNSCQPFSILPQNISSFPPRFLTSKSVDKILKTASFEPSRNQSYHQGPYFVFPFVAPLKGTLPCRVASPSALSPFGIAWNLFLFFLSEIVLWDHLVTACANLAGVSFSLR